MPEEKQNKSRFSIKLGKLQPFIIGLLLGIIIGGGLVWHQTLNTSENMIAFMLKEIKSLAQNKENTKDNIAKNEKSEQEKLLKNNSNGVKNKKKDIINNTDSIINVTNNDSIAVIADSIVKDTGMILAEKKIAQSIGAVNVNEEKIVVKKDELVQTIQIDVKKIPSKDDLPVADLKKDSTLSEISGISKTAEVLRYSVEFWESPINYKGYKMANKKIVLFGLEDDYEHSTLYYYDKKVYLKHNNNYYLLENTYEFKPLKKITDDKLITELKK
jgi:hypothetical protein